MKLVNIHLLDEVNSQEFASKEFMCPDTLLPEDFAAATVIDEIGVDISYKITDIRVDGKEIYIYVQFGKISLTNVTVDPTLN